MRARRALAVLGVAALSACGGGGAGLPAAPLPPLGCSVPEQKVWLRDYMREWYFWYRIAPDASPLGSDSLQEYFDKLLYKGGDPTFPADRWSRTEPTESFERFYGEGKTMGYGLAVAGLEVKGQPQQPLYVRYVEPTSDASAQRIRRGERVVSLNGRSAAELIEADDFKALTAEREGQKLEVVVQTDDGLSRTLTLTAGVYALTPVSGATVLRSPQGRRVGYLQVKEMISQALPELINAFSLFRAEGVDEVVLDLRYNGGGLVSTAATLASHTVGGRVGGTFTQLLYNDQRGINNQTFSFSRPSPALALPRVLVLAGRRTCSAAELVVNGLAPHAQVVVFGEATCGKPVGFLPTSQCGTTYSVVNFESVNSLGQGRYFDGLAATCAVAENFRVPIASDADPLLAAARSYVDTGRCPAPTAAAVRARPLGAAWGEGVRGGATDGRGDMIPR